MWNFNSADSSLPGQVDELARLKYRDKIKTVSECFMFFLF